MLRRLPTVARMLLPVAAVAALLTVPVGSASAACTTDSDGASFDMKQVSNDAGTAAVRVRSNGFWTVCGPPPAGATTTTTPDHLKASVVIDNPGNFSWADYTCRIYNGAGTDDLVNHYLVRVNDSDLVRNAEMQVPTADNTRRGTNMRYVCDVQVRWGSYPAGDDFFTLRGWQN